MGDYIVIQELRVLRDQFSIGYVAICCYFHLEEDIQSHVGHIAHGVLECPHHRVKDQFELSRRYVEERLEAVRIDRLQQLVEA